MYFSGLIIAFSTFLIIGLFHPLVIKTEYYCGTKYWPAFLIAGAICVVAALFIQSVVISALLGVLGASFLWSIKELFDQQKRVEKGWFPRNPKRR